MRFVGEFFDCFGVEVPCGFLLVWMNVADECLGPFVFIGV
jgi:hypothetical protein